MATDNKIVEMIESTQLQLQKDTCVFWKDIQSFRDILEKLENSFRNEVNQAFFDEESEKEILVMFQYYQNACIRGNEKSARQILTSIIESIYYLRRDQVNADIYAKRGQQQYRLEKIRRLNLLIYFQDYYDELNCRIQKMEQNEEGLLNRIASIKPQIDVLQNDRDYYETHIVRIRNRQEAPTAEILEYVNKVNNLVDLKNAYARSLLLKEKLHQRGRTLNECIQNINLIIFGTSELLGNHTIEKLTETVSLFEENLKAQRAENIKLKNVNDRFTEIVSDSEDILEVQEDYENLLHMAKVASMLKKPD